MGLNNIQKLAIFTSILVAISSLFLIAIQLKTPASYPDFMTGHITWSATTKFQDLIVMPVILFGASLVFLFFARLFRSLRKTDSGAFDKVSFQLVLWSLPAFSTLSGLLIHKGIEDAFIVISVMGLITVSLASAVAVNRKKAIDIEKISTGLLMVLFVALIPLSLMVVINIAPLSITAGGISTAVVKSWVIAFLLIGFFAYLYCVLFKYDFFDNHLPKIVLIGQSGLALLYFTLYPARLMVSGSSLSSYETNIFLKLLIITLVLLAFTDVIYRYFKYNKDSFTFKLISPLAIIGLIIAMRLGNTVGPSISTDDYHFGQNLLGWWVYFQGYLPYVDFIPAHGLINNDFAGLLSLMFYDGTASSLGEAKRLAYALLVIVAYMSIYIYTKSLLISFISIYYLGGRITCLFLLPFAALWFHKKLIASKVKWSLIWFITAPLLILGVPPQGLLLVAASGVIPLYFLWTTLKNREWFVITPVVFSFFAVSAFYIFTPLGDMLFGAISYVLINAPINQVAYGVPWSVSFNGKGVLFEVVRMSWVVVPAAMLFVLYFLYCTNRLKADYFLPVLAVLIFSLLLIPYSMGRIDPGSFSRPGAVGILLISGFMSLVIWNLLEKYDRIFLITGVVLLASLVKLVPISLGPLWTSPNAYIHVGHLRDTTNGLLANIGRAHVNDGHWERLNRLAQLMDAKLHPDESYLDLTSRNAQYFYVNRKPLVPVTAPYNMPGVAQQLTAIERLGENLPRVALLEGENINHDGGGLALRNHYLYRFVLEHYVPFEIDGFVIGLSKEALDRGDWGEKLRPDATQIAELFERSFSRQRVDLRKLPVSWGRSIKTLGSRMKPVIDEDGFVLSSTSHVYPQDNSLYSVKGHDPFLVFDISKQTLSGKMAGLLTFEFECQSQRQEPKIQLYWWGDEERGASETNSLFFNAENGTLIVPLDASPRWYLINLLKGIRIDLHNPEACESFSIKNLALQARD